MRLNFFQILFVLALFCVPTVAFAGQLDILSIESASTIPVTIYPGDIVTVTFNVSNISGGGQAADDINVFVELNLSYFTPIKTSELLGRIAAQSSKAVSLRFAALEDVLPGVYNIPVSITYLNESTKLTHHDELTLDLSSCSVLKVDDIVLSSSTPHIGELLDISASVKNNCSTYARNVSVELKPVSNGTIAPFVVSEGTLKKIGDIAPLGSKDVSFSVLLTDRIAASTYVFSLDANCDDCVQTFSNKFSFLVLGKPELVFSNIEYSVDTLAGGNDKQIFQGSDFTLSIQLDNIGQEKAKATDVTIDFGRGIEGTTKSFLGNINPDDSGAAVYNLRATADAVPGAHEGVITVSFTDETGQKKQFTQIIHSLSTCSPGLAQFSTL